MKRRYKLAERQYDAQLLAALCSTFTIEEAAQKVDLHPRTVYRRLEDPEFTVKFEHASQEIVIKTFTAIAMASEKAAVTLVELLKDESPIVRLRTAAQILKLTSKYAVHADHEWRIRDLEESKSVKTSKE